MKGAVVLEDGTRFQGEMFGALGPTSGEVGEFDWRGNRIVTWFGARPV